MVEANNGFSSGEFKEFGDIQDTLKDILAVQGNKQIRIQAWKEAAANHLFNGAAIIPEYDRNYWVDRREGLTNNDDSSLITLNAL